MDTKSDKIKLILREIMRFAPALRKNMPSGYFPPEGNIRLSKHQLFGLHILGSCDKISMSGLADKLGVSNQQLTRIMDGLVESGLAERYTDPDDRRSVQTVISGSGRETLKKYIESNEASWIGLFEKLSEEELDAVILHFHALTEILIKADIINVTF